MRLLPAHWVHKGSGLQEDNVTTQFKTWYMDQAVFNLAEVIETAKDRLKDVEYDTLVGTGFSGGIVIPSLALALGKKFVLIRKDTDDSHHGKGRLVGELGERWIFVDDFVSSGRTRARVIEKIAEAKGETGREAHSTLVGQYMYLGWDHEKDDYGKYDPASDDGWMPGGYY